MSFRLKAPWEPTGDQPPAIQKLVAGIKIGRRDQVLLGVTGSGKTYTIAQVIAAVQKPTLVMAHNKTLAAQLYQEFKEFFPDNAVGYFVSYYDFYQPEAYIPQTDTYIEKETDVNEEIDKLRLRATSDLLSRRDCIIVASVSCIYNLGNPIEYQKNTLTLQVSGPLRQHSRDQVLKRLSRQGIIERLVEMQYARSDFDFHRGTFRLRGEMIDVYPSYDDWAIRIGLDTGGTLINQLIKVHPVSGEQKETMEKVVIYPAKHYVTDPAHYQDIFAQIRQDMEEQVAKLQKEGKELEAHRLKSRVSYDLEMIAQIGYVNGIENYSCYFDGRQPGEPPFTLLDYFPKDYLLVIDESHMTIPQVRGMYEGDKSRKETLISFGFRLPAARDNRPLRFAEFRERQGQTIYTSATPDEWEIKVSGGEIVEQLVRPTGIVDPEVSVRPTEGQIPDLVAEIEKKRQKGQRVLVTTLTKRMAEELTEYLNETPTGLTGFNPVSPIKVAYLHSDIQTLERTDILRKLRLGEYDVLVGINLLREGLDLPEVGLVAILDADKEGFLRSKTALIQTMGRAARHVQGEIIMYADAVTPSMREAIREIARRREYQLKWNEAHEVIPQTVEKSVRENPLPRPEKGKSRRQNGRCLLMDEELANIDINQLTPEDKENLKKTLTRRMKEAAKILDFEGAAVYRDKIKEYER